MCLPKTLVQAGVDLNAKDYKGNTALRYAIEKGDNSIEQILREAGASE